CHFHNTIRLSNNQAFSLSLNVTSITARSQTLVNQTFTTAASAIDWFNSHTISFGQAGSLGTPQNESLNLVVSYALTVSNPNDYFNVETGLSNGPITVPEPSTVGSILFGAALLIGL